MYSFDYVIGAELGKKAEVIIIGGGIAGVSAAIRLLDNGYSVNIIESRKFLGGRSFSFRDKETGIELDNGQHVITKACSMYLDLCERLGILNRWQLQDDFHLRVYDRFKKIGTLKSSPLPAPFHLAPSFFTYGHLNFREKMGICAALYKAKRTNRDSHEFERLLFVEWLVRNKQTPRSIEFFWNLLVMPILNDRVEYVSTRMALMAIQEGLLKFRHNADIGYPVEPLSYMMAKWGVEYFANQDSRLTLSTTVTGLKIRDGSIKTVELKDGTELDSPILISAIPVDNLLKILPRSSLSIPYFKRLEGLQNSPIVNIHFWYDRKVMDSEFCVFVDTALQWVFNKNDKDRILISGINEVASNRANTVSQHICISLSAAWEYIDQSKEDLIRQFRNEMSISFPVARRATVIKAFVIKQRKATFRCLPGSGDIRPASQTPYNNLFLAGDWTDTGWPSTMESAVRSGYNAAQAIITK